MSRIHEALKRAEREKSALRAPEASPAPAPPAAEPVSPSPAAQPVAAAAPAPAPVAPLRVVPPGTALLECCRRSRWYGDTSKLFFLSSRHNTFATEQFRNLRSRLYLARERGPLKTLLVTSALPAEGKTFICANLAYALARQPERRVLLMDCHLRAAALHSLLGAPGQPGLTACLRGEATLQQVLQRGPQDNLFLIPGGPPVSNLNELLAGGKLKALVDELAPLFDWILLDTPAVGAVSDALRIAAWCDGSLLVVEGGKTPYDKAQRAAAELPAKRLLGVVLNRANPLDGASTVFSTR